MFFDFLDKRLDFLVEGSAKNALDLRRLDIICESLLLQFHLPHTPSLTLFSFDDVW